MSQYDYLVVGAGLSGAVFANAAKRAGKSVLVIDRRDHIAGNIYTEDVEGIQVHRYGAHIFHTSMRDVWDYVNRFAEFNNYVNSPVANFHGNMYNMPFNMNTFAKMWPGAAELGGAGAVPRGPRHLRDAREGYPSRKRREIENHQAIDRPQ